MTTISLETLKKLIRKELEEHYTALCASTQYQPDPQIRLVHNGWHATIERLESVTTIEELDDFLGFSGYEMNTQEWINSL